MSTAGWIAIAAASVAFVTAAAAFAALLALLRQNGRFLMRLEALEAKLERAATTSQNGRGAEARVPAPGFRLPDVTGAFFELHDLRGQATVLLFWDPGSTACEAMLGELKAWERHHAPTEPTFVLISTGGRDANVGLGLTFLVLLDESGDLRRAFGIRETPAAVLLDEQNSIASGVAVGADAVLALGRNEAFARA